MADERNSGLGGSDVAAVAGLSPYRTPSDVFLIKTGRVPSMKHNPATDWGQRLEGLVLDRFQEVTKLKVMRNLLPDGSQERLVHPKYPWAYGHPDAYLQDNPGLVEVKTTGHHMAAHWGEEGTDEIPTDYLCQIQWYLELRDDPICHVPVLVDGRYFKLYKVERDPEFAAHLLEAGERFWKDHILTNTPPVPRTHEEALALWKGLYPQDIASYLESTPATEAIVDRLRDARAMKKHAETEENKARADLEAVIGNAAGIEGTWGRIDWKKPKDSQKVDWQSVATELNPPPGLLAKYTSIVVNARRFTPRLKEID
jgi:putative phage-type endonuclease